MNTITMESSLVLPPADVVLDVERSYDAVAWMECDYPGFAAWYWETVVPGLSTGVRRLASIERDGTIVGVGISKRSSTERKMCTIWVDPAFAGSGMGVRLMKDSMRWLGTEKPLATVSEARMPSFAGIMARLGYELTQVLPDYYVEGQAEYVFNGALEHDA